MQEESAALLNQMFAQQMAGNPNYTDPDMSRAIPSRAVPSQPCPSSVLFDSRVMPSQPPLAGLFDPQDGAEGSEGPGGSRSSAPNPFEPLTSLPFKSQTESGGCSSHIFCAYALPTVLLFHATCSSLACASCAGGQVMQTLITSYSAHQKHAKSFLEHSSWPAASVFAQHCSAL